MSRPELEPLAAWGASYDVASAAAELQERLFATILDWSTALIAGTGHDLHATYLAALRLDAETGPCQIAGAAGFHPVAVAAAANAAISHFWEVDDAHRTSTSHPGITVIPAVMALAEVHQLPARTAASAMVAGFETVLRVGSHLGVEHYGVCHTTATAGALGAASAAARAMELDTERTLWALGHAGTQAAGLWQFLDDGATDAKAFHAAAAVRNGLAAVRLAEAGIPGAAHILEGPRGMRQAWKLADCDPDWLAPRAKPMIHDVTIKGWPVCGQMHSALDCAREVYEAHPDACRNATSVRVELPASALAIANILRPRSVAEAKFSTAFCIAAVLCGRAPSFRGLNHTLLDDPHVRALAVKVDVAEAPEFTARFPKERPARVTVSPAVGEPVGKERAIRNGDPEAPWSRQQLETRTADILCLSAGPVEPAPLVKWCDALARVEPDWRPESLFELMSATRAKKALA